MNRTDRLYTLVEELRARAPRSVPARALAAHFEVSTRTIERDLLALQEAGVPIWARPGPGGGYGLNADTTLPPLNLTPAEAAALATALAALPALPFAGAGRSALQKLTAVMAAPSRATAAQLLHQIRVVPGPQGPAAAVSAVAQQALLDAVAVEPTYHDAQGSETVRVVEEGARRGSRRSLQHAPWLVSGGLVLPAPGAAGLPAGPHHPGHPHPRAHHPAPARCRARGPPSRPGPTRPSVTARHPCPGIPT